MILYYINVTRR